MITPRGYQVGDELHHEVEEEKTPSLRIGKGMAKVKQGRLWTLGGVWGAEYHAVYVLRARRPSCPVEKKRILAPGEKESLTNPEN